jgi:serine/threonine protein phosphatase PrpC
MADPQLTYRAAIVSRQGRREDNQDFAGIAQPSPQDLALCGAVLAVADGMGGAKGGRVAAEMCVHGFMEAWYGGLPETLGLERRVDRALGSANLWIHAMGRRDPNLAGMGSTFSAVILRGRRAHLAHVGDSRIYRLRGESLERLSEDHTLGGPEQDHILYRAVGLEDRLRIDYSEHPLEPHDRFLLCSDGLYGALKQADLARVLLERATPESTAETLVELALQRGSQDNVTALVADVLSLPKADRHSFRGLIEALPLLDLPKVGDTVDGFRLEKPLASGRYGALFIATDERNKNPVVLKFPHPRVATEREYCDAFLREAWIGARVKSPWVAEILEQPAGRQTRLYSVMPFYSGETLEQRVRRGPPMPLEAGMDRALKLCKAVHALHRQRIVHRDIKPDNVLLMEDGGLRLLDLGIARLPAWDEDAAEPLPGTPSYMAPELFQGERGSIASDVFALGVTIYRMFADAYPYGEVEPFSTPRFGKPRPLDRFRPDLPVWLDAVLARAFAVDPAKRYADSIELAYELEAGMAKGGGKRTPARRVPWYERNPLLFWKLTSLALFGGLLACLFRLA